MRSTSDPEADTLRVLIASKLGKDYWSLERSGELARLLATRDQQDSWDQLQRMLS